MDPYNNSTSEEELALPVEKHLDLKKSSLEGKENASNEKYMKI
jgi:hypothetical protein